MDNDDLGLVPVQPEQDNSDLGLQKVEPDMSAMKSYVASNLKTAKENAPEKPQDNSKDIPPPTHPAKDLLDAIQAGWQMSVSGLGITHRGLPDTILPEDAGRAMRIASQIGQLAGDAPAMVAGLIGGATVGAPIGGAVGTSVLPGVGTLGGIAAGAGAGAMAGAFAAPAAMRKILMDHYEKGDIQNAGDFLERSMATTWEAMKGAATGVATYASGGAAAGYGTAAKLGAELATMTTVSKALEGHLPNANDFLDGAVVLGGLHGLGMVAPKLRAIYAETGLRPEEVVQESLKDPTIKQDILSTNVEVPKAFGSGELPVEGNTETVKTDGNPNFDPHETNDDENPAASKIEVPQAEEEEKSLPKDEPEDVSAAREAIRSRRGEEAEEQPQSFKEWVGSTWNKVYQNYFDALDPIKRATEGKDLPADQDPYGLGRRFAAYMGKVTNFFEKGTIDFKTQDTNGESLKSILKGVDFDRLRDYWTSRHALDLNARGIETGFDMDAAQKVVDHDSEEFQPLVDRIVSYKNRVLKYYADSGMVSKEVYQKMVDANKNHASFYRVLDEDGGSSGGKGQLLKAIKGSSEKILDPIASTFNDTERLIQAADRNNVLQKAITALGEHFETSEAPSKPITVTEEELKAVMERQGIDATPESMQIFRKNYQPLDRETQVAYYEDGKRIVKDTSPDMAEALNGLGQNPMVDNLFIKMARPFAQTARFLTTANPAFALRHVFRAQFFAGAFSKSGQIPFADALRSIIKDPEQKALWDQFVTDGGAQGSLEKLDKDYFENDLEKLNKEAPFFSRAWNYVKNKAELSEVFIRAADNLNRFAEYKKSLQGNESPSLADRGEAAMRAREVGVDYSRSGAKMAAIAQISAFFNAKVQGLDLMGRNFADDPVGFSLKASKWVAAPTLLNWAANHDDPRYKETPSWEKMMYWVVPIDHWRSATNEEAGAFPDSAKRPDSKGGYEVNDGPIFRFPKPPGLGQVFGSSWEAALNAFHDHDPAAAKGFAEAIMNEMPVVPIPNMIAPMLEQATNHSFFTGNPIVPSSREKLLPELQYTEYTSDTAKALGKMISYVPGVRSIGPGNQTLASPLEVENYMDTWGGGLGKYAVNLADKGLQAAGVYPDLKPASKIAEMPFAKEFMVRYPMAKSQSVETFMERSKEAESVSASLKFVMKQGDPDQTNAFMQRHPLEMNLEGIKQGIDKQNQVLHMISQNPQIDKTQKRQLMDGLYYQMINMATQGNKILEQMNETRK